MRVGHRTLGRLWWDERNMDTETYLVLAVAVAASWAAGHFVVCRDLLIALLANEGDVRDEVVVIWRML